MAERNADFLEIRLARFVQHARVDVIVGKALRVGRQAKLLEPFHNLLHGGRE